DASHVAKAEDSPGPGHENVEARDVDAEVGVAVHRRVPRVTVTLQAAHRLVSGGGTESAQPPSQVRRLEIGVVAEDLLPAGTQGERRGLVTPRRQVRGGLPLHRA